MKKITLLFILVVLMVVSMQGQMQHTYYRTTLNNKTFTSAEFDSIKLLMERKVLAKFKSMALNVVIESTVNRNDSIIKVFSFHIGPKEEKKEKVYGYLNKKLPPLELYTLEGKKINPAEIKGKPTLINFWFTTCSPCIDEMPVLNRLREKYKDRMNFIAVTFNNKEAVEMFLEKHQYEFTQIAAASDYTGLLGIVQYPKNIFLDKNGVVRVIESGIPYSKIVNGKPVIENGKEFEMLLQKLLQ